MQRPHVWQPFTVSGTSLSIPQFIEAWQINTATGVVKPLRTAANRTINSDDKKAIKYSGRWLSSPPDDAVSSDASDASFSVKFNGRQIGFYSITGPYGGYAQVIIKNSQGQTVVSAIVDMYCSYKAPALTFLSPMLAKGNYTLTATVMGKHSNWADKHRSDYGSKGNIVSLQKVIIN